MLIREYIPSDCEHIAKLFYDTVHCVNIRDYTEAQVNVWATGHVDLENWNQSFTEHYTLVAEKDDVVVGFGDIDSSGYLDRLYIHKDHQGEGIATAICDKLERTVRAGKITTHASITAKPFFENRGYTVVKEQQVERRGICLTNYVMEKMKVPGVMVKVNDTFMHVCCVSQAKERHGATLVFLAGSGTECPIYDFKPLWMLLVGEFNMVVVERPGYGWSGTTEYPRDIDTILEETREVLRKAGIEGPYIPIAHSLSGLEAIYWTQKYPNEVDSIIGLDMAVPQVYESLKEPKCFLMMAKIGHILSKPLAKSMVKGHPAVKMNLLDTEEQTAMREIVSRQLLSKNMLEEVKYVKQNAKEVAVGKCPQVPVLCCLSADKANLKRIPSWGKAQRDYFSPNDQTQFLELTCGHYVHREDPETIAKSIIHFLD